MKKLKQIEILDIEKNNRTFIYTGYVTKVDDEWISIDTIRGEHLQFRKEQIMQRRILTPEEAAWTLNRTEERREKENGSANKNKDLPVRDRYY